MRLRLPSLHAPIPRENSAARPARATPPFRAEARPQAVPEADTRADHERFRAVHDHQRHARDAGGGARVFAGGSGRDAPRDRR